MNKDKIKALKTNFKIKAQHDVSYAQKITGQKKDQIKQQLMLNLGNHTHNRLTGS